MACGDGQGDFRLVVMINSAAPDVMFESVWRRSAFASGSSSSVAAELVLFSSRTWA